MSRPIKMTPEYVEECRQDFVKKMADGKISFTKTFTVNTRKATVHFTSLAWLKMTGLIRGFDKEVAWHGVARRGDDESKDEYIIEDIVVYPQEVSGASVEMDTEKYAVWLMENDEDERFQHLHMQGHSHVNMGVTPSSVDLNHQEEILNMLGDDDFYIFMIWNKSLTSNTKIYDMRKNILFESADVSVTYEPDEIDDFVDEAKKMVVARTTTYTGSQYGSQYGSSQYNSSLYGTGKGPYNPLATQTTPPSQGKKDDKSGKKDGKKGEKPRGRIGAGWQGINGGQQPSAGSESDDEEWMRLYGTLGGQYGWGG